MDAPILKTGRVEIRNGIAMISAGASAYAPISFRLEIMEGKQRWNLDT